MTSTTHRYTHHSSTAPGAHQVLPRLCVSWPLVQTGTKPGELDWSVALELLVLLPETAFSHSRAGQGPAGLPAAPGERPLEGCSENHSFLQVSEGPCSSAWSSHLGTNLDFRDAFPGEAAGQHGSHLSPPLPGPWPAATVTSPPPRRAVSWGVGRIRRQRSREGCWEARQGVSPGPFSAQPWASWLLV